MIEFWDIELEDELDLEVDDFIEGLYKLGFKRKNKEIFVKDIINHNDRVFKSESNKKTWYHIEQFNKKGMQHRHGEFQNLQTIRNLIKINLL